MTNFKKGQKIVCVGHTEWECSDFPINQKDYPKTGEMVTCNGYDQDDNEYIFIKEYPKSCTGRAQSFHHSDFRSLLFNSVSSEIIEKFKLTEEKADIKIKEYENA